MLVSKTKVLRQQNVFFQKIQQTPYKVTLEIVEPIKHEDSDEFSMDEFVGDNPRESKSYTFRCLYERNVSDRTREKYGLPREVDGVVYLSPKQLTPIFGDYHIDWNRTKVHFSGSTQVVNKVVYLEEFEEYKTCIGIQIFVRDALKGG